jgi:hypothetical protein
MLKKLIAAGAALAVALGIVALATVPAQAHDHSVNATCSGLTVNLTNYADDSRSSHKNSVVVTINGVEAANDQDFGSSFHFSKTWNDTQDNTYRVVVHAWDSDAYSFDTGTLTQRACEKPSATLGTVTPHQAACDAQHPGQTTAASFVITGGEHVTYSYTLDGGAPHAATVGTAVTVDVSGGSVAVVITPTATSGYKLPSYDATKWSFTLTAVAGDCLSHITVSGTPTVTEAVCTAAGTAGTGSVQFPDLPAGAKWQYSTDSSTGPWTDAPSSLTGLAAGSTVWAQITVTGSGYVITNPGATGPFTLTLKVLHGSDCVTPPAHLAQTQAVCDAQHPGQVPDASYTVPTTTGVIYKDATGAVVTGTQTVQPGTTVKVYAYPDTADGYRFPVGTSSPTVYTLHFDVLSPVECVYGATHGTPTFEDSRCDLPAHPGQVFSGDYVLPAATGVTYHVSVNGSTPVTTDAGTYSTQPGDVVVVTETAQAGYTLDAGYPAEGYTHTFGPDAGPCLQTVTASAHGDPQTCTPDDDGFAVFADGAIVVTVEPHVVGYTINGTPVDMTKAVNGAVTVPEQPGTYLVAVQTEDGYTVDAFPENVTVAPAQVCGDLPSHALVTPTFTPREAGCFSSASFTLGELNGDSQDVIWTVNGSTVAAGTYPAKAGTTYTAVAAATKGNAITPGARSTFTFTPTASSGPCDLKTLALTGTGNPIGWIGLGYLLLVIGLALAAVPLIRRRRAAE